MAKKRKKSRRKGHHPTAKAKRAYYKLIEKGARRTMSTLKKHDPAVAKSIAKSVLG